jgi:predicted NBD/HSP70 family sugar kinase
MKHVLLACLHLICDQHSLIHIMTCCDPNHIVLLPLFPQENQISQVDHLRLDQHKMGVGGHRSRRKVNLLRIRQQLKPEEEVTTDDGNVQQGKGMVWREAGILGAAGWRGPMQTK